MIVKRKLFARGTKEAGKIAKEFLSKKGNKIVNKAQKREYYRDLGLGQFVRNNERIVNDVRPDSLTEDLMVSIGKSKFSDAVRNRRTVGVNRFMKYKEPGDIKLNKEVIKFRELFK